MRRKIFLLLIAFNCRLLIAQTQVGIGTSNPHSSAVLDISSNSKGFLVPRMTQAARLAISNPSDGLLVYDSTLHRLYQLQDGVWRYMLTNADWIQSSTHNWTYNTSDSIGIGLSVPTEKLDVNGDIHAGDNLRADNNIVAGENIIASSFTSTGSIVVTGNTSVDGTVTTYGDINLDDASAIVQLQSNNTKYAFFQVSGNDLRFGTNSGNTTGKIILKMNAIDAMSIDRNANINLLQTGTGEGNIIVGWKVCRFSKPDVNMLPVLFGYVPANGGGAGWISPFGSATWSKVATGKYEVNSLFGVTPYCAIIATPSEPGRICTAKYVSPGLLRIETFTRNGTPVDCAFTYIVNDPLN